MSLDFDLTACDKALYMEHDPEADKDVWKPFVTSVIFETMAVGIGEITESDACEFYARSVVWRRVLQLEPIEAGQIHALVGLKTNVWPREPRVDWLLRIFASKLDDLARVYEQEPQAV